MPMQGGEEMTNYLMNKVEEIKRRLGQGDMGALSNVTELMRRQDNVQFYGYLEWT